MDQLKGMTEEQRTAYFDAHPHKHIDMQREFAAAANLSLEQSKVVAEALRPPMPNHKEMITHIQTTLNRLAAEGTISTAQANQLFAFFEEKAKEHQTEFEEAKKMTPEERHAYLESRKGAPPDILADLEAAANLSKEQAQAVAEMVRPPHGPKPPFAEKAPLN